ncbi:MAG: extracellular solute-binding protein [Acidibacillus sp.]|uniref:Uncharacterized protein n=1 Tax=Sulfoacidibacillus ferrooxidans TaxID=2005001 RepID=A0A9X2ACF4_9BACL|nr:extracellular solute-binding protein [Sulfoacidibacillus ferrooxidans]MCI0182260.1 hypothetical protein [Sulfoacidibacillus ferrooxidans]MCY0893926.1 extracellular solute-binding protein [Acidibacillus sp.]
MKATTHFTKRTTAVWSTALTSVALTTILSGCGTQPASTAVPAAKPSTQSSTNLGTANVAYAGSLQLVNDTELGPQFTRATGIPYEGRGGGSFGIAHLITSGQITPNVFESVGIAPIQLLQPHLSTYAIGFASSPLVIAYSPTSPYASTFKAIATGEKPLSTLFTLMESKNFHLGRTNPNTDPQGQAFVMMMELAQTYYHFPHGTAQKILGGVNNPSQIFSEESILSRLQAGQLDASSAFLSEAVQRHLPYITLPSAINFGDPTEQSVYATAHLHLSDGKTVTGAPLELYVTSVQGTPNTKAGVAFISYLLSKNGLDLYEKNGYQLTPPVIYGNRNAIPASILHVLTNE